MVTEPEYPGTYGFPHRVRTPRYQELALGVFEFVLVLVLITTLGKVATQLFQRERPHTAKPQLGPGEMDGIRETIDELSGRVGRLEEERDFYKALLESPERQRELPSPGEKDDAPASDLPGGGRGGAVQDTLP